MKISHSPLHDKSNDTGRHVNGDAAISVSQCQIQPQCCHVMTNQTFPFKHCRLLYEQALQKKYISSFGFTTRPRGFTLLALAGSASTERETATNSGQVGNIRPPKADGLVRGGAYDRIQWWLSVRIYYQGEYVREQPWAQLTWRHIRNHGGGEWDDRTAWQVHTEGRSTVTTELQKRKHL